MKTKNVIFSFIAGALVSSSVVAADICVNELGSGGCYPSITAALAVAVDGDRILIEPKAGGVAYIENVSISKSVQLLSNNEATQWVLSGNITITPAIGRSISIMHMKNNSGNITATGDSPAGARCKVNIMDCELVNGYINLNYNYFNVNIASNEIKNGYVALRYGNVIGNFVSAVDYTNMIYPSSINYTLLYYLTDAVSTDDTLFVVGNTFEIQSVTSTYYANVLLNSNSQFFYVANNFLKKQNTYYECYGIRFYNHKNSAVGVNSVYNNTIYNPCTYGYNYHPIHVSSNTPGFFDVKNNFTHVPGLPTNYASYTFAATPTVGCSYNFASPSGTISGIPNDGTNNFTSNSTVNVSTGELNVGSDGFDAGYPDYAFYDLDLTVNDVGCYGGSFSFDNFYPVSGPARVYFVNAPRTILQSGTLTIKANSFDR